LPHLRTQIIKRSDQAKGFVVLPKRWIVERTLAWLNPLPQTHQGLGETSIAQRLAFSCASPQSGSCSENFVILTDVSGQNS